VSAADSSRYFVIKLFDVDVGVAAVGEIANVSHTFQPSDRFSAANSL
jgi:hypothetical protein